MSSTDVTAEAPPEQALHRRGGRVGANVAALAGGQAVTWSLTLGWALIVPRALGPAQMGLIVTATAVAGILGLVLGLGTRAYLVREMVLAPGQAPSLLGTALVLRALLVPLFFLAIVVYGLVAGYGETATVVLYLAGLAAVLTLLAEPVLASFQAVERMGYIARSDVVNKGGQAVLGVALALLGLGSPAIVGTIVLTSAVALALNAYWLRHVGGVAWRTSSRQLRTMARESVSYWTLTLVFTLYLWIDSVLLSLLCPSEVVGWYGVATKLLQTLMFLPFVISTAWLPSLVKAFGDGHARLQQAAREPIELVLVLGLPIAAATAACARPAIHLLYGDAYADAVPVLQILAFFVPPTYVNIILLQILVAANRQALWARTMVAATVLNPLLNLALIPVAQHRLGNGAIGAAISLVLTELALVAIGIAIVGWQVVDRGVLVRTGKAALASAVLLAVAYAAQPLGALPALAAAGAAFVGAVWALRILRPAEVDQLRRLAGRIGGRRRGPAAP